MPLIGESINVWVLLESSLRGRLGRFGYYSTFVQRTRARVVIVWHDTNLEAYCLSTKMDVPVVCIQNGVRVDIGSPTGSGFLTTLRKQGVILRPKVNAYFVLSESERARMSQFVDGEFFAHGSLRANHFAATAASQVQSLKGKRVGFIVSFPNSHDVPTMRIADNHHPFISIGGHTLSYVQYFAYDALVARALFALCTERDLDFAIIGKRSASDTLEADYFSHTVSPLITVLGHEKGESYSVASNFDYLVTIDSTLGFEMLGLGKPVAFLPNRIRFCGVDAPLTQLSFLDELPSDGACWSSATTEEAVGRFLGQWLAQQPLTESMEVKAFTSKVISLDRGNSRLRAYLRDCITASS
jgi:surface carbohydrate biosynthesis protein